MKRNEWKFTYTANDLAEAAKAKQLHHQERLTWWETKQEEVIDEVKSKGLEVTESLAMGYATSNAFTGGMRGAQLTVKSDYQQKLNECHQKIRGHGERIKEYDGWVQMLSANQKESVSLDIEDWLFFFGK